jgi:hypothetical protein
MREHAMTLRAEMNKINQAMTRIFNDNLLFECGQQCETWLNAL